MIWTSSAWNNNIYRRIDAGEFDPHDSRLELRDVGSIKPYLILEGKGEMKVFGSSPRVYIWGQYQNVEMSCDIFVDEYVKECYLVVRSNHHNDNEFGGYYLYINFKDQRIYFKKEISHDLGYSPRLNSKGIVFPKQKWVNASVRVVNINDGYVRVDALFNNETSITLTDKGTISCGNDKGTTPNTKPFTGIGKVCFLRTNEPKGVRYRNLTIGPPSVLGV